MTETGRVVHAQVTDVGSPAPDPNKLPVFGHDVQKGRVGGLALHAPDDQVQALDSETAINDCHHDLVVLGLLARLSTRISLSKLPASTIE